MLLDAVFPAASELVMLYAGALASGAFASAHVSLLGARIDSHTAALATMVASGTLGYLAGALIGWAIGVYAGRPYVERHPRLLHLPKTRLAAAERWFERFGLWAIFLGRLTPLVRSFVSIPAGLLRAPLRPYALLTLAGSALWCLFFAAIGWALGRSYRHFHSNFRFADYAVAAVALFVLGWLGWRLWRRRAGLTEAS